MTTREEGRQWVPPEKKVTLALIVLIGAAAFLALIPANRTGAADPEMLAIFEVDEYAQYPHALRMATAGGTLVETLRNFFVYLHYFYGFPFYALSGGTLVAAKSLIPDFPNATRTIVCLLRMVVSVLPMILCAALLTGLTTGFRSRWRSIALFVFLLTVPAVVINDFWWHPDSLSLLLVCLVIVFLERDADRFGRDFYVAAALTGAAIGTKYQGLYFALTIPTLLLGAVRRGRLSWRRALTHAAGFVAVTLAFVVVSNPLLLLPQERAEIFRVQSQQFAETGVGTLTRNAAAIFDGFGLNDALRADYGDAWFWILAIGGWGCAGLFGNERERRLARIVLSYAVTAFTVLALSPTQRSHYFLALAIPLFSGIVFLTPGALTRDSASQPERAPRLAGGILTALWLVQFCSNLVADTSLMKTQLRREADSPKIAFYEAIEDELDRAISVSAAQGRVLRVLRDAKAYFPKREGVDVRLDWGMLTGEDVAAYRPDWILIETENLTRFGDSSILAEAIDEGEMAPIHAFYAAAARDELDGYFLAAENGAQALFVRNGFQPRPEPSGRGT